MWSILWDLYDPNADANDTLTSDFQPLWNVLINEQRTTRAFTSIFSFISALKTARPANAAAINTLLAAQNIDHRHRRLWHGRNARAFSGGRRGRAAAVFQHHGRWSGGRLAQRE